MEGKLWSCTSAIASPLATPVLRIVSRADPIIDFDKCVDPALFANLDKVIVQAGTGHCACFTEPGIANKITTWRARVLARS